MRSLIVCILVLLGGCAANHQINQSGKTPALQLAEASTRDEGVAGVLRAEFSQKLEIEQEHWRTELSKTLTGAQLEKALQELRVFNQEMSLKSETLSSADLVNQRIAEYFDKAFTPEELQHLAKLMASPEWRKYQFVIGQMSLAPDTLGLRADFAQALEKERDLMGERIFGKGATTHSVSTGL